MNYRKDNSNLDLIVTVILFVAFVAFTIAIMVVDVQPVGPQGSMVGFATINAKVHSVLGCSDFFYLLTKLLLVFAYAQVGLFGLVGLYQLVTRKSLFEVDLDIICLGVFYVVNIIMYVVFEILALNYRPIIMDEGLEASYPSSHVFVMICIFATTMIQVQRKVWNLGLKRIIQIVLAVCIVLAAVGRLLSGVHWFTDIVGGCLLAAALTMMYWSVIRRID